MLLESVHGTFMVIIWKFKPWASCITELLRCTVIKLVRNYKSFIFLSYLFNKVRLYTKHYVIYFSEPINIFNGSRITSYEPIRLSYHRMCHYNSISNPNRPSVGVGLGLPNYKPTDIDRRRLHDAVRASEELLIEQVSVPK